MIRPLPGVAPLARLAIVGACALALSGCISLLPKTKPVQLYRFTEVTTTSPSSPPAKTIGVFRANGVFQSEAAGDRLVTVDGGKIAYVAGSRWVSPASLLFDHAVLTAFDASAGPARLLSRGEPGTSEYALRLDVRNFEARYENGPKAAPVVLVRIRAALSKSDHSNVGEEIIEARVPAADNRVGPIVAAYDAAVAQVLAKLIAWTNAGVTASPA